MASKNERSKWEITLDLLKITLEEKNAKKTRIQQRAYLDWKNFQRYFDYLLREGFISKNLGNESYEITDKGKDLLRKLKEVDAVLGFKKGGPKILISNQDWIRHVYESESRPAPAEPASSPSIKAAQEALKVAQAEVERERQARIKAEQARAEAERALAEAKKAMAVKAKKTEPLTELLEIKPKQPVSSVAGLPLDERGQAPRTEVEHVQSSKKKTILPVQQLAAFMKACIIPPTFQEPATPVLPEQTILPAPPPIRVRAPTQEPPKSMFRVTILNIFVSHIGAPGVMTLILNSEEAFLVQARFQLQGPEAPSLRAWESSFEIKVFVKELTSGKSRLLTTYNANLVKDVLEYTAQIQVPGLSTGIYQLITLVTLHPLNMAGYHEGPIIQVLGFSRLSTLLARGRSIAAFEDDLCLRQTNASKTPPHTWDL